MIRRYGRGIESRENVDNIVVVHTIRATKSTSDTVVVMPPSEANAM